jgi:hypothetical protein
MTENAKIGPVEALTRAALAELPENELEAVGAGKQPMPTQDVPTPTLDRLGSAARHIGG